MNTDLIEEDVKEAVEELRAADPKQFVKRFKDRRFDAWEAKVDDEIRNYLLHAK